jgi:hypothetical protein
VTPKFLTPLETRDLGNGRRRLLNPLIYRSVVLDQTLIIPTGFEYDGMSVPRWIPAAYAVLREAGNKASCVHDFLYSHPKVATRAQADAVLREALEVEGADWLQRNLAWLGVRAGGWAHYRRRAAARARLGSRSQPVRPDERGVAHEADRNSRRRGARRRLHEPSA